MTDGFSSLGVEFTKKLAGSLKRTGLELFSVGTSDLQYKSEIEVLVSKPSKSHELFRDLRKSYFKKDEIEQFARDICKKEWKEVLLNKHITWQEINDWSVFKCVSASPGWFQDFCVLVLIGYPCVQHLIISVSPQNWLFFLVKKFLEVIIVGLWPRNKFLTDQLLSVY